MKNIIGFIRQNFTFFSFLILQIVSLVMLSSYSKSHETFFGNWNNAVAGNVNSYYNEWAYFFDLKATNAKLVAENVALRNELAQSKNPAWFECYFLSSRTCFAGTMTLYGPAFLL